MAAKKKPASAADFRMKEEADKKKMAPIQTTAKYNGKTVNWQTPKPKPGDTLSGNRSIPQGNSTLNRLHNEARAMAVTSGAMNAVTKAVVKKVESVVGNAAFSAASKGLSASGVGGKIKDVVTPMGRTIASTRIGTPAQQSARMGNLIKNADRIATITSGEVAGKALVGMNQAGKIVKGAGLGAIVGNEVTKKKKK